MFYESKAQGSYHLRNAVVNAGYVATHINRFLLTADVKPSDSDISFFKFAQKAIKDILARVE